MEAEDKKNYSFSRKFIEGEVLSGFWNTAFRGISSLSSFIIVFLLSVYEYGFYQLILSVVVLAEKLTTGIFDDMVTTDLSLYLSKKQYAEGKKLFWEYALMRISLAVILVGIIILGAELIQNYYHANIALFLRIVSLGLIFSVAQGVMEVFFKGDIYFLANASPVFGSVIRILSLVVMFYLYGLGMVQILWSSVIGQIASFLFSLSHFVPLYKKYFYRVKAIESFLLKVFIKAQGVWLILRYLLAKIANGISPLIMKIFVSTEAIGLFFFAQNILSMTMSFMPLGMFQILMPRELDGKVKVRYFFIKVLKFAVALSVVFSFGVMVILPILINIFLPKYIPAISLIVIMSAIVFMYAFYKTFRMILTVFKDFKALFIRTLDNSILAPLFLFFFLPVFGIKGAAIEAVLTYTLTTLLFYFYLSKNYPHLRVTFKDLAVWNKNDRKLFYKNYKNLVSFIRSKIKI